MSVAPTLENRPGAPSIVRWEGTVDLQPTSL